MGGIQSGHHSMMGSTKDPADGKAVAGSVFAAVVVYAVGLRSAVRSVGLCEWDFLAPWIRSELMSLGLVQVFLVFCGFQAFLHVRQSKRGAISLN